MKLNPQDLEKITNLTLITITSAPKLSGKARAITTSTRTSLRCYNASRVNRLYDTRFWLRGRPRPQGVCRTRSHCGGFGRRRGVADRRRRCVFHAINGGANTHRSGKDTIDHPRNGRDDFANAACGVLRGLSHHLGYDPTFSAWQPGFVDRDRDAPAEQDINAEWRRQRLMTYLASGGLIRNFPP